MTYELCTGERLFEAERPPNISSEEWQLCLIWKVLGTIPKPTALIVSGKKTTKFFDSAGNLKKAPMNTLRNRAILHELVKKHDWKLKDARI